MNEISRHLFTRPASFASSRVARTAAVAALAGAMVVGTAIGASAHVGVLPDSTVSGHESQLTFRVPDDSETANTIKLVVTLPQDRPFTDVSTQPMQGWTAAVAEAPLPKPVNVGGATVTKAPRTVTWTALPGYKIALGEYQNFYLATDALPAAGELVLPVAQYYSDGTVVHWTEPTVAGRPEPEHPAPVFNVTAASASEASASATPAADTQASSTSTPATTTSDNTARVLGGIALVLALVAGGVVLLRRRPKTDVKWSHSHLPANRWRLRCLAVLLAAVALLVGAAAAAQAHNVLVATSPADGSTVKVVPAAVMLTFNEPALAVGTEIIVTGPAGQVQTGAAALVNNTVSEHLSPGSPAGQYKVVWRVASADGHPVAGTFSFTATAASAGQRPTATTATNSATSTPASGSGRSLVLWVVAGGVVVLLLVVSFIRIRKPRTTPHEERDDNS